MGTTLLKLSDIYKIDNFKVLLNDIKIDNTDDIINECNKIINNYKKIFTETGIVDKEVSEKLSLKIIEIINTVIEMNGEYQIYRGFGDGLMGRINIYNSINN